jgi:hypothetical protein
VTCAVSSAILVQLVAISLAPKEEGCFPKNFPQKKGLEMVY